MNGFIKFQAIDPGPETPYELWIRRDQIVGVCPDGRDGAKTTLYCKVSCGRETTIGNTEIGVAETFEEVERLLDDRDAPDRSPMTRRDCESQLPSADETEQAIGIIQQEYLAYQRDHGERVLSGRRRANFNRLAALVKAVLENDPVTRDQENRQ